MIVSMNHHGDTRTLPDPVYQGEFYRDVPTKRFIAFVIDSILITAISILLVPLTAFTAIFYFAFLGFAVSFVYRTVGLARRSATPGMRLTGIAFRTVAGERMTPGLAAAHTLIFQLSLAMVFPQILSVVLMLTGARGQGLGDRLLGVVALNRAARG